jgi:hypothetical protein
MNLLYLMPREVLGIGYARPQHDWLRFGRAEEARVVAVEAITYSLQVARRTG